MAKLFSTLLVSFFLLFQTALIAEEENNASQITEQESESDNSNEQEQEEVEPEEELSELEKEALAAEEAEIREAGMYDDPESE